MTDKTKIEWTDATWNPVTGCSKVSAGCKHCYAERQWPRLSAPGQPYAGRAFSDVQCHPERLDQPLRWRRPRRIFVNSMSDLFHPDVPDEFVAAVWGVMRRTPQHTYQVLTKRPGRMAAWLARCGNGGGLGWIPHDGTEPAKAYSGTGIIVGNSDKWPLPNVWLGVSVEDQATADERVRWLLDMPAAVRWVSVEPMLGPVELSEIHIPDGYGEQVCSALESDVCDADDPFDGACIDWVVCGGESGPMARPMHPDWVRSLRDQCAAAQVPFLFKQWGVWAPRFDGVGREHPTRVGKRAAGRLLDGALHDEYPET